MSYNTQRLSWQDATHLILITIAALLIALTALAEPVAAQLQPIPTQPLRGIVYTDLNNNGRKDYGEPVRAGVLVEARHISGESPITWRDTSDGYGEYHLLLWDPGQYHLTAHCTEQTGQFSSVAICWQSPSPLIINGSGRSQDIPLPASHLYLPIIVNS